MIQNIPVKLVSLMAVLFACFCFIGCGKSVDLRAKDALEKEGFKVDVTKIEDHIWLIETGYNGVKIYVTKDNKKTTQRIVKIVQEKEGELISMRQLHDNKFVYCHASNMQYHKDYDAVIRALRKNL